MRPMPVRALLVAAALFLAGTAPYAGAQQAVDIDIEGGAFDQLTWFRLQGPAGRKHLLLISVFHVPGSGYLPDVTLDIGTEFLDLCLGLPGFVNVFDLSGQSSVPLVVPTLPVLDSVPLYLQAYHTVKFGNTLEGKSDVQIWTLQSVDSWKAPYSGTNLSVQRSNHSVTVLPDETLLLAGGNCCGITGAYGVDTVEIYDLKLETLTVLPATMVQPRTGHTATLLDDGRVLLAGGAEDILGEPTDTAEVFDPATQTFAAVGSMVGGPRALHRAVKLPDGRVLITGGTDNYIDPTNIILGALKTTEIFDPVSNTFSAGPVMHAFRLGHTATGLASGDVLVAGGYDLLFGFLPFVSAQYEIYQYAPGGPGSFAPEEPMFHDRMGHAAVALPTGDVLLVGGANGTDFLNPQPELTWEIWNATSGFYATQTLNDGRILPSANLLADGDVLIAGGATGGFLTPISVQTAERWDAATFTSTAVAGMVQSRAAHNGITLPDGTVLVSGGGLGLPGGLQDGRTSLEIYQP